MPRASAISCIVVCVLLLPALASAQTAGLSAIAGVAKDATEKQADEFVKTLRAEDKEEARKEGRKEGREQEKSRRAGQR